MLRKLIHSKTFSSCSKWLIFTFLGFDIGFITYGWIVNYFTLSINPQVAIEISPLDLISLVVNIFLVVVVLRNFQKDDDVEKIEKELIVKDIQSFREDFTKFARLVVQKSRSANITYQETAQLIKRYRTRFIFILDLTPLGRLDQGLVILLKENMLDINIALTNNTVVKDIIQFDDDSVDKLATLIYKFESLIFKYSVEIMRSGR